MIKSHRLVFSTLVFGGTLMATLASAYTQTPISEYSIPTSRSVPRGITRGPDGSLWFVEYSGNKIGRISVNGVLAEFALPTAGASPASITGGPDGNVWFTEGAANKIGRITPSGVITEFDVPKANAFPESITGGPDGNLWFTEGDADQIGRVTPAGIITEFPLPIVPSNSSVRTNPVDITAGPDGNLWFTHNCRISNPQLPGNCSEGIYIGKITPTGVVAKFTSHQAGSISKGPDGNLWFSAHNVIGRITPVGTITEFRLGSPDYDAISITAGPDGNVWFTETSGFIGRITPSGALTEFRVPDDSAQPGELGGIVSGLDGNLWLTDITNNRVDALPPTLTEPIDVGFTGNWYDPSESGHGFSIEVLPGNQMLAQWYVFGPHGAPSWIVATGPITGNTAVLQASQALGSGGRFPPGFDASRVQNQPWGTITFTSADCNHAQVSWQPTAAGYTSGVLPLTRLTMPAGLLCPQPPGSPTEAPAAFAQSGFKQYSIPSYSNPTAITRGQDGNLWFTESGVGQIAKITPAGVITEYPIPNFFPSYSTLNPTTITQGPDGNLWFTDDGVLSKITTAGVVTSFPPADYPHYALSITPGPDGNLWVAEYGPWIGRITPAGGITEFPLNNTQDFAISITSGPDGNLWFVEQSGAIGKISPAGTVTEYQLPGGSTPVRMPFPGDDLNYGAGITAGADGNLWFVEYGGFIGRITPAGVITQFPLASPRRAIAITSGPGGNLWFAEVSGLIGKVTLDGVITEFPLGFYQMMIGGITAGPDGNVWLTDVTRQKIISVSPTLTVPIDPGFTGNWYDPSQSGQGFSIEVLADNLMLAQWYVFGPDGGQAWITATGPITGNTAVLHASQALGSGGVFPPNFDPAKIQNQPWGSITFMFSDCNAGLVSWVPTAAGYSSGSMPIKRLTMPAGLACP